MNPIIKCTNLTKCFSSKTALNNINLELEAGQPIALVGPNGSGKTTLFSLMCGYIAPTNGDIHLYGNEPGHKDLFGKIAALPQDAQLDPRFGIAHQLSFYAELQGFSRKQALIESERVLEWVQLKEVLNDKPSALSHGMRKRVTIAQALIGSPKLVLLDEPTAGLDPVNARNIRQMVEERSGETTFIISSHNLNELEKLCNTVIYLKQGELCQQSQVTTPDSEDYLTLHMEAIDLNLCETLQTLDGVEEVSRSSKNEYLIRYHPSQTPDMDQLLLHLLSENGWQYRQLTRGKTLEEQLFSKKTAVG